MLAAGVSGAIVLRPVLAGGRHPEQNEWKDPQYRRFLGFSPEPAPQGEKKVSFFVEVLVYSLEQDKLLWAGKSAIKVTTVSELIDSISAAVIEELNKEGLIGKN